MATLRLRGSAPCPTAQAAESSAAPHNTSGVTGLAALGRARRCPSSSASSKRRRRATLFPLWSQQVGCENDQVSEEPIQQPPRTSRATTPALHCSPTPPRLQRPWQAWTRGTRPGVCKEPTPPVPTPTPVPTPMTRKPPAV